MKRLASAILILSLLLTACGTGGESFIPGVTAENYPRIDGSANALGIIRLVFERVHPSYIGDAYPVEALGAEESYKALLAGELDLVIAPYAGADILVESSEAGVKLEFMELGGTGFYAVTRADLPDGDPARAVAEWLTSPEGETVLAGLELPSPEPINTPVPEGNIPGVTAENYPRIDGSTSTLDIVRTIYINAHPDWQSEDLPSEAMRTVPSYRALIAGDLDLIIVPYASADVLAEAEAAGVELEFTKIAAEALVFITPKANTAQNITYDQVREIYLHNGISNWTALGGPDRQLVPICRNADSGSQSQMDNLILHGEPMAPEIEDNYLEMTMDGMLTQVAFYHNGGLDGEPSNSYALGYTLFTYLRGYESWPAEELKMLDYEGVPATEETIASGEYPISDGYYAVTRAGLPQDDPARAVVDWLLGSTAEQELETYGYFTVKE